MISIVEQLKILPELSGSYQFYDKSGAIIYVGKAKNLKKRVTSYFVKKTASEKLKVMVPKISKIEFIITNSEIEALILESHLIKEHKPKYNVLLKDDKKFPYFVITDEAYPRILVTRKRRLNQINGKYFGPYTDARAMYATLDLLKKLFPLKQCKTPKFKDRPCIYYQIGRCMAPCQQLISSEDYKKIIANVELFLTGKQMQLVDELKKTMEKYAQNHEYEKAARFRDSYFDVQKTIEKQKVVSENTSFNQDIISVSSDEVISAVSLLQVRAGRLIDKKDFEISKTKYDSESEILTMFIKEYYEMVSSLDIPKEILFIESLQEDDKALLQQWLSVKRSKKVELKHADTQRNSDIINLAKKNSDYFLSKIKIEGLAKIQNDYNEIGSYIQEKLKLPVFPHRVECFDISHIQGTNTVASMVVFENGIPKKTDYKRFKIKLAESKPDDFLSMREVIYRRYKRFNDSDWPRPDLIIIDGGKGQLSSAKSIIDELGLNDLAMVSLAKRIEEIFIVGRQTPVIFPSSSNALYFFQRIRDEAHRFAITYHRTLRGKKAIESKFDDIPGLFEKSKKLLLEKYKDISIISKLKLTELSLLLTKSQAKKVYDFFNQK